MRDSYFTSPSAADEYGDKHAARHGRGRGGSTRANIFGVLFAIGAISGAASAYEQYKAAREARRAARERERLARIEKRKASVADSQAAAVGRTAGSPTGLGGATGGRYGYADATLGIF